MRFKKLWAIVIVIALMVNVCVGCTSPAPQQGDAPAPSPTSANSNNETSPQASAPSGAEVIKIGVLYPLTGNNATAGNETVACLRVAAELVNNVYDIDFPNAATSGIQSMNGAQIQIVTADTQASPEVSATEAERLITEEGVVALIGCDLSSCTKTASAVAERYGIPFVNGESSSDSLIGRGLDYFFHVGPVDSTLVASTYDYLDMVGDKIGLESIAICGSDDDAGALFVKLCEENAAARGYNVSTSFIYSNDAASLSSECLKLKSSQADVLLIYALTAPAILYLQTLREMDINFKAIITARGGFVATEFFNTVGDSAEYIMTQNAWSLDGVSDKDHVTQINDLCIKQAGCGMNGNYARAMQAFFVLVDALERAGTTESVALKDALWATDMDTSAMLTTWNGCKFDEGGQNIHAAGIMTQVQGGQYVTVHPEISKAIIPVPAWNER